MPPPNLSYTVFNWFNWGKTNNNNNPPNNHSLQQQQPPLHKNQLSNQHSNDTKSTTLNSSSNNHTHSSPTVSSKQPALISAETLQQQRAAPLDNYDAADWESVSYDPSQHDFSAYTGVQPNRSSLWTRFKRDPFIYFGLTGVLTCFTTALYLQTQNKKRVLQNYLLFGRVGFQAVTVLAILNYINKRNERITEALNHNVEVQHYLDHPDEKPPEGFDMQLKDFLCD